MRVTFITMKFSRYITNRLYATVSSSNIDYHDLLLKNLPLKKKDISNIFFLHEEKISDIPPKQIIKNCELIRNFNVVINPVANIGPCLKLSSSLLKHRIFLLQELGVPKIHIDYIFRLPVYMKGSVNDSKKYFNIPTEQNIMLNLLRHIDDKISDPLPLELLNESLPLVQHYEQCVLYFAMRELDINDVKRLSYKVRKYKSFRLMKEVLKIFREEIGVDQKYFRSHPFIFGMCPDKIKNALESLKDTKIGTMTIQQAATKKPEILEYDIENTKNLLKSLKKYEVDDKAVDHYLLGLKLQNDVFIDRMKHLLNEPDIKVWCKNSRLLHFLVNEKTAIKRIDYLRKTNSMKWANMYLLTSSSRNFRKFLEDEMNHINKRVYVKYILHKELGFDKPHLMDLLTRHPYWNRVPFTDMDHTLCSLKKIFSIEDICNNIHLILYPWSLVQQTLNNVQSSSKCSQNYTSNQRLAYCLYLLEQKNHFTGDGVWNLRTESEIPLIKEETIIKDDIPCKINENLDMLNNTEPHRMHTHVIHSDIES